MAYLGNDIDSLIEDLDSLGVDRIEFDLKSGNDHLDYDRDRRMAIRWISHTGSTIKKIRGNIVDKQEFKIVFYLYNGESCVFEYKYGSYFTYEILNKKEDVIFSLEGRNDLSINGIMEMLSDTDVSPIQRVLLVTSAHLYDSISHKLQDKLLFGWSAKKHIEAISK